MYNKFQSVLILFMLIGGLFAATDPVEATSYLSLKSFDLNHSSLEAVTPQYTFGQVSYTQGDFDHLVTDLEGQIRLVGAPDLPSTTTHLVVPETGEVQLDFSYTSVRVESNVDLVPFQPVQLEKQYLETDFSRDAKIYEKDAWFPENPVILHGRAQLRDLTVMPVEVTPFQYNPVRRELRVYEGLVVNLNHSEPITPLSRPTSRFYDPIYRGMVPNSILVLEENYQTPSILYVHPNNVGVSSLLTSLVNWRTEKGFEVHTINTSLTGTSGSQIKSYIQTAYDTWDNPPEFVVLVGDVGGTLGIPTFHEDWTAWYNGEGDHPYVHLAGADYIADAFVGRIPYGSTTELSIIISKILNYEKNPDTSDPTWFTRALLVGDRTSSGLSTIMTNENINEYMQTSGYDNNFEVYGSSSTISFVSNMTSGLNSGVSFFNYRGYLGMSGWGDTQTGQLNNGAQLPFVTILTCGTGDFAGNAKSEKFLKVGTALVPKGGIGAIGTATTGTHTLYNNCVSVGLYHGIFMEDIYYAGAALERGRLNLNATYPTTSGNYVEIFSHWNNLMGDPSTELWTGVPADIYSNAPAQIPEDALFLSLDVTDDLMNGIEDVWVSLTGTDVFVTGYSDADGSVVLELPAILPASMTLTLSKHNHVPSQSIIGVSHENYAVLIDTTTFTESVGNGDEMLNPGETAVFNASFSNMTDSTIHNVTIDVKGEGSEVASYFFASLDVGATITLDEQSFDIPVDYPGIARFDVAIDVEAEGMSFNDHRRFDIYAPYLQINSIGETGLPPYTFEPGEISDLVLFCENVGSSASSNLTAVLRCANPDVTILDSTALFTDAAPEALTNNSLSHFEVEINTQVTRGVQVPFQVEFTDDNGFVERLTFLLPIGTPGMGDPTGPDAGGYFAYEDQDLAYALAPEYDWIEIAPPAAGSLPGTLVPLSDNTANQEDIETVSLPFDFGFYGVDYNQISICSNGYIALGESETALFRNYPVPGPMGPSPMIAPFWDDLIMGVGDVYTYFDAIDHYFVIEYYRMKSPATNHEQQFQVILYDPDYYGSTDGNGDIKIQYHTYNNTNSNGVGSAPHGQYSTTGIEDHTGQVGIQITYNNTRATTAHTMTDGSAILFTTRSDAVLPCPGWARGDINHDGQRGIQDLIILVNVILGEDTFGECEFWAADKSLDSTISVSDVILLVDEILGNTGLARTSTKPGTAEFIIEDGSVSIRASQPVEAFAFTVKTQQVLNMMDHAGLTIVTREIEDGYKVLGYWAGEAPSDVDLFSFQNSDVEILYPEAGGAGGAMFKSTVVVTPENFEITSVYPNPFNPTVNIAYSLPTAEEVTVHIFNALGQEVNYSNFQKHAGEHVYTWNGLGQNGQVLSSGIYFARVASADSHQMVKLTYLR